MTNEVVALRRRLEAREAAHDAEVRFLRGQAAAVRQPMVRPEELMAARHDLEVARREVASLRRTLEARDAAHEAELLFVRDRHRRDLTEQGEAADRLRAQLRDEREAARRAESALADLKVSSKQDLADKLARLKQDLARSTADVRRLGAELDAERARFHAVESRAVYRETPPRKQLHAPQQKGNLLPFLDSHGLARFLDAFRANGVNSVADLRALDDYRWKRLGLPLGPLRKLQASLYETTTSYEAIAFLSSNDEKRDVTPHAKKKHPPLKKKVLLLKQQQRQQQPPPQPAVVLPPPSTEVGPQEEEEEEEEEEDAAESPETVVPHAQRHHRATEESAAP